MKLIMARYLPGSFVLAGPLIFALLNWWVFLPLVLLLFSYFARRLLYESYFAARCKIPWPSRQSL